jgi:hypothetical protein
MEYPPKKVKIQNLKTGKITETTVVAVEVMKKHGLFKGYEVINGESLPKLEEVPAKKTKKVKLEVPTQNLMVEDLPESDKLSVTDETPTTPEINQNIIE